MEYHLVGLDVLLLRPGLNRPLVVHLEMEGAAPTWSDALAAAILTAYRLPALAPDVIDVEPTYCQYLAAPTGRRITFKSVDYAVATDFPTTPYPVEAGQWRN